jgi:DNA-binding transcriptional MerR regulator
MNSRGRKPKDINPASPIFIPSEAGRKLGVGPAGVHYLEDCGLLQSLRSETGYRVYLRGDVERLALERSKRSKR